MGHGQATSAFFQVPFSPFFLKVTNLPTRPLVKNLVSKYLVEKWGKFEVSTGIQKIGDALRILYYRPWKSSRWDENTTGKGQGAHPTVSTYMPSLIRSCEPRQSTLHIHALRPTTLFSHVQWVYTVQTECAICLPFHADKESPPLVEAVQSITECDWVSGGTSTHIMCRRCKPFRSQCLLQIARSAGESNQTCRFRVAPGPQTVCRTTDAPTC